MTARGKLGIGGCGLALDPFMHAEAQCTRTVLLWHKFRSQYYLMCQNGSFLAVIQTSTEARLNCIIQERCCCLGGCTCHKF